MKSVHVHSADVKCFIWNSHVDLSQPEMTFDLHQILKNILLVMWAIVYAVFHHIIFMWLNYPTKISFHGHGNAQNIIFRNIVDKEKLTASGFVSFIGAVCIKVTFFVVGDDISIITVEIFCNNDINTIWCRVLNSFLKRVLPTAQNLPQGMGHNPPDPHLLRINMHESYENCIDKIFAICKIPATRQTFSELTFRSPLIVCWPSL